MTTQEMIALSAVDAVAAMRDGRMTAVAYADALIAQCAARADLNAFITLYPDAVRAAARAADARRAAGHALGPLHGLPIPVKDSINTADLPTTAGTSALREFRPATDATVVALLRAAGAIILGKTNLHELSFGWTSSNMVYGPVRNPCDPTRIPGGSSGGTAAAVAARMAPLGVAEDNARVDQGSGGVVRHSRLPPNHRAVSERRLRTDNATVRSGRAARALCRRSGSVRRRDDRRRRAAIGAAAHRSPVCGSGSRANFTLAGSTPSSPQSWKAPSRA